MLPKRAKDEHKEKIAIEELRDEVYQLHPVIWENKYTERILGCYPKKVPTGI